MPRLGTDTATRFRWAFCQLDRLRRCRSGRIRKALDELPTTLDETYERTLLDIDKENWAYAHRLFQCITVASRPLRVEELAEFLAFDLDDEEDPRLNADLRSDDPEDEVLSICSSLVAVVEVGDTKVVQFSHFSVKEFLMSSRIAQGPISRFHISLEPAHLTITRACLAVLLLLDGSVNKATIKNFPLAFYAARYWVGHAEFGNVSLDARGAIQRVFDPNEPYFSSWTWLDGYDHRRESISETPTTPKVTPLHLAAYHDLVDVAEWLITSRSHDLDAQGVYHMTPLYYASDRGKMKVAQVLIKHGADVNSPRNVDWCPLHAASSEGHLEISRLLIESGANVNAQPSTDGHPTPLSLASYRGHLGIVRILLENGADHNLRRRDETPLIRAWISGHFEVAELLLKYGADINASDKYGYTALHLASMRGDQKGARQLLEHGANIHVRNRWGKTPLQVAPAEGEQDIVELLLQFGAEGS